MVAYGEHARRYVAAIRGRDDDVFVAPQSVEPELFAARWPRTRSPASAPATGSATGRSCCTRAAWPQAKGVDVLAGAWPRVRGGATLVVAGDGPLRGALDGVAGRAGSGRWLARSCVVAYAAADVVVVPSDPHAALPRALGAGLQRGHAPGHAR